MKALPTVAAAAIALALLLVPFASTAAGSITFTSPASGASYKGTQSYSISGTVSPAPTQPDNVGITVKNPSGQTVDVANVAVSTGAFSYATATGSSVNPSSWPTGTYTISATDSFGATGTTTFSYNSGAYQFNLTRAILQIQRNQTLIEQMLTNLNKNMNGNFSAIKATQATQGTTLAGIVASLSSLSQAVSGLQTSITGIGTQVGTINTNVQGLSSQVNNAATQAQNAASAVASTQTYVLVVAVLAALTVVLELAILVRKLS
jgi:hypothetical protein